MVALEGILKAGSPIGLTQLFARYQKGNEESIWTLKDKETSGDTSNLTDEEKWLLKYSQPTKVKVVGVWDTVGSVGVVAGNIPHISRSQFDYLQTGLFIPIQNGYHALAIDEHRGDFDPTLWTVRHPKDGVGPPPRSLANVEQRWFVGAHANVGGGYQSDLLNQAPLRWLMQKAELHGLSFRSEVTLDGDALKAPIIDSYHSFGEGLYAMVSPLFIAPLAQSRMFGKTEPTPMSTRRSTSAYFNGGALIQSIVHGTLSSGRSVGKLIPPS